MKFEYYFQSLKDLMEIMKDKDFLLKIKNKNHNLILEQLDSIVVSPLSLLVSVVNMSHVSCTIELMVGIKQFDFNK